MILNNFKLSSKKSMGNILKESGSSKKGLKKPPAWHTDGFPEQIQNRVTINSM